MGAVTGLSYCVLALNKPGNELIAKPCWQLPNLVTVESLLPVVECSVVAELVAKSL